ncbi:hypothetical protein ACWEO2_13120 [Nocardia sp. NPDC004278]
MAEIGGIAEPARSDTAGQLIVPTFEVRGFGRMFVATDMAGVVAMTTELGGTVRQPISDSPAGRSAVIAGPQGAAVGIIDPSKTIGAMPAPKP